MPGRFQRAAGVSSTIADLAPQPSGDAHVAVAAGDMSGRRGAGLALIPRRRPALRGLEKFANGGERRGSLTSVGLIHRSQELAGNAPASSFRRDHRPWSWKSLERLAPPCF